MQLFLPKVGTRLVNPPNQQQMPSIPFRDLSRRFTRDASRFFPLSFFREYFINVSTSTSRRFLENCAIAARSSTRIVLSALTNANDSLNCLGSTNFDDRRDGLHFRYHSVVKPVDFPLSYEHRYRLLDCNCRELCNSVTFVGHLSKGTTKKVSIFLRFLFIIYNFIIYLFIIYHFLYILNF